MNNPLKIHFILFYFILFYFISLCNEVPFNKYNLSGTEILLSKIIIDFLYILYILYLFIKNKILYPSIIIKILLFTIVVFIYFMIEQSLLKLFMYSIGDSGGWIRNHIYENINYQFQWYEVLFWNFIFSLHYPIYIFLFFKPFVNHLDKSIKEIKSKK